MDALIVYESMFGNTRRLAEAIGDMLRAGGIDVTITPAREAPSDLSDYQLVVVGAPTHAHSLPRPDSRSEAAQWAADANKKLLDASGHPPDLQRRCLQRHREGAQPPSCRCVCPRRLPRRARQPSARW